MTFNTSRTNAAAQRIRQSDYSPSVKSVCLTALEAVGRLKWAGAVNDFNLLIPGRKFNAQNIGCVCYQAPIALAVMAGQLSQTKADSWYKMVDLSDALGSERKLINHIYTRFPNDIRAWFPGLMIPAGAMVFHGRRDNPCAHVTLSVGNAEVVSCWGAGQAGTAIMEARGEDSDEYRIFNQELTTLGRKQLLPDTMDISILSFTSARGLMNGTAFLRFTTKPFWELW